MTEYDEDKIYTGEWYWLDNYPEKIQRKSKDTFVFLKDFKLKMMEIRNVQTALSSLVSGKSLQSKVDKEEFNERIGKLEKVAGEMKKKEKQWENEKEDLIKEIQELKYVIVRVEGMLSNKIEKLEKEVYDLKNPPLKPILKNPFD